MKTGGEQIELDSVEHSRRTDEIQRWYVMDMSSVSRARLTAKWKDQGWGNQKGAICARVVASDGTDLYSWRRIGPRPAPHEETEFAVDIPSEFFCGEYPVILLSIQEGHFGGGLQLPSGELVATACFGNEEATVDCTDMVRKELTAGRPVFPDWRLLGDPRPGEGKTLTVTLKEGADIETMSPMPNDASLELGFVVGGGGGHRLFIKDAVLHVEKTQTVLTATFLPSSVVLTTMGGETIATVDHVTADDSEESQAERIREAVQDILGPGKGFRVIESDTGRFMI